MNPWWYYGIHTSTGLVNWVAVALSSLADVLPQRFRAPGIGIFLAGFMLGISFAPIFSLLMNHVQVALTSFLLATAGLVCTIIFLPETLPPHVAEEARRRRRQVNQDTEQFGEHSSAASTLLRKFIQTTKCMILRPIREMSILNRNTFFRLISLLAFFSGMVSSGDQLLLVYYIEEKLAFTDKDISIMFLILGISGLLAQGLLLKPLNDCVGEKMLVAICFFVGAVDNSMYGLATNKTTIYVAVAISGLAGMAFPTISAIKSNNVVSVH
jgi:Na+/melibiose symporter-like transporter